MARKSKYFTAAKFGWAALAALSVFVLFSGQAPSIISQAQLPQNPFILFGAAIGAIIPGWLFISYLETRSWQMAGRRANLKPAVAAGLFGKPDLIDSINGRTVRARIVKRNGSSSETFTVVEAELNSPAEEGVLISPVGGGRTRGTATQIEIDPEFADVTDDQLAAVASSEALARSVLSGRARNALIEMGPFELVFVGDAADAFSERSQDMSDSRLGSWFMAKVADRIPGDAETVSIETKGVVYDGDRLRRQAEAVAAVADAFEEN